MPRLIAIAAVLLATPAVAASGDGQIRCGWLENPTPGNFSLLEGEARWTIDRDKRQVTSIRKVTQKLLKDCRDDARLPRLSR
jgi:hypothetical protein